MASFAQTLRSYSSGSISREDLISSLDDILSENRVDAPWLLSILDQEHQNVSLPKEIYEEVKLKVMGATDSGMARTRVDDGEPLEVSAGEGEDLSRTQIATSFVQSAVDDNITTDSGRSAGAPVVAADSEIAIKGVGDVLNGRFVLEECVGSGGMSTVYRALDRRKLEADDRDPYIAVKILNVEFRSHPDSLIALQREAKKCHKLAHPNIVRAYDFDRDDATVYMTMEYLHGHSLAKILRDPGFKGMPCNEAMPIIQGMAEALAYAHKNGIVHADFKPANVILTEGGEVKVIDFGIARAFHKQGDSDVEATRFDPGSLGALTPTYASPEMLEHREPDPRDDVYAFACIVYEMLTGRHPFGRRQANEARDGGLAPERKTLSRRQWKALRSALEFDRDKRTPSIEQFFREINPECTKVSPVGLIASALAAVVLVGIGVIAYQNNAIPFLPASSDSPAQAQTADSQSATAKPVEPIQRESEPVAIAEASAPKPHTDKTEPAALETVGDGAAQEQTAMIVQPKPVLSDAEVLQSIKRELNAYKCSAMTASMNGGTIDVVGYLKETTPASELARVLDGIAGGRKLNVDVQPLTANMCAVVDLYRQYWIANRESKAGTSILPANRDGVFVGGEPLVVKLTTPAYDSFVNVDYYALDGHVVHMLPSLQVSGNQAPANYSATLGDLGQWIVGEPFGRELVVVLTTPKQLFGDLRDGFEKAPDYLSALSTRLAKFGDAADRRKIMADFMFINTRPK
ncbi:MAG: serine/threonine-protein kinase [Candidatus Thiodiazotropha sp.]